MEFPMRINKYLAHTGVASRRESDTLIEQGKVIINGKKATMGQQVVESDVVEIKGKTKAKSYLAYYKGRGIITHSPAEGEVDIAGRLATDYGITHVAPVGRLDKDSEGLIILSNDGRITGPLLDPEENHEKEYDVLVDKPISGMFKKAMELGVDIEGYRTKPATIEANQRNEKRFTLIITEGKKHQIRRMCAALGYQVQNLKRVRIMNVKLEKLKPNQYRKIQGDELTTLLKSLGLNK
ncbi:rRNA pseudouridine synthase [Candidatus Kaiserbacteria bacterium]|nr:rRNA pseudouridine synthase [Candidatus Kaiserbacteria bacterium]